MAKIDFSRLDLLVGQLGRLEMVGGKPVLGDIAVGYGVDVIRVIVLWALEELLLEKRDGMSVLSCFNSGNGMKFAVLLGKPDFWKWSLADGWLSEIVITVN